MTESDQCTVFSSALVLIASLILHHGRVVQIRATQNQNVMEVMHHALSALEHLGSRGRMAKRCRKYLEKLLHGMQNLGKENLIMNCH